VNRFAEGADAPPPALHRTDPALETAQREALARLRAARDGAAAHQTLARLRQAAQGTENLLPFILEAVKARATLGEVSDVFRDLFGEYRPS
jgi:methylmalonyl-CoA mutase N-terminal domain/subunit